MTGEQQRMAVITEARTWLATPWHHGARIKGVGVDCAQYLAAVYAACGLVPHIQTDPYPMDWHMHRDEPRFLCHLLRHACPVERSLPADIAMFRFGRHAAHGAIVIRWPQIIHAYIDEGGVVLSDAGTGRLAERFAGFYRLRIWAPEAPA